MATAKPDPRIADVLATPTPITGEADPEHAKAVDAERLRQRRIYRENMADIRRMARDIRGVLR